MLVAPTIMMTSPTITMPPPTPVPAHRSRLISISPVSSLYPYDLIPAHLGRPMPFSVFIAVIIAAVVGKNNRWKRG
jgi:hypothetical protein